MKARALACAVMALAFCTPALQAETTSTARTVAGKPATTIPAARKAANTTAVLDISPRDFDFAPVTKTRTAPKAAKPAKPAKPAQRKPKTKPPRR